MTRFGIALLSALTFLTIHPVAAQPTTPPGAFLRPITLGEESWFTLQHSRDEVIVRIIGVNDAVTCLRQKVQFIFLTGGTAASAPPPSASIPAQWVSGDSAGVCQASLRWRLGDTPGVHQLRARLERDTASISAMSPSRADSQAVQFRVTAHAPANLIVGLARTEDQPDDRKYTPIVGADFPIVSHRLEALYPFLNRLRFSIATQFGEDAGDNVFLGLEVFPFIEGPRVVAFPLQLSLGYRTGKGSDGGFVAAHYNASAALSSVLSGLGIK